MRSGPEWPSWALLSPRSENLPLSVLTCMHFPNLRDLHCSNPLSPESRQYFSAHRSRYFMCPAFYLHPRSCFKDIRYNFLLQTLVHRIRSRVLFQFRMEEYDDIILGPCYGNSYCPPKEVLDMLTPAMSSPC